MMKLRKKQTNTTDKMRKERKKLSLTWIKVFQHLCLLCSFPVLETINQVSFTLTLKRKKLIKRFLIKEKEVKRKSHYYLWEPMGSWKEGQTGKKCVCVCVYRPQVQMSVKPSVSSRLLHWLQTLRHRSETLLWQFPAPQKFLFLTWGGNQTEDPPLTIAWCPHAWIYHD